MSKTTRALANFERLQNSYVSARQSQNRPTQNGHLLDLVFHGQDEILRSCELHHGLPSDHTAVLCHLNIPKPATKPDVAPIRCLSKIDFAALKQDIANTVSPDTSISELNDKLRAIFDTHAPIILQKVPQRKPTPWYSAVADELQPLKQERRRAERQWKKSGLVVHKQILKCKPAMTLNSFSGTLTHCLARPDASPWQFMTKAHSQQVYQTSFKKNLVWAGTLFFTLFLYLNQIIFL